MNIYSSRRWFLQFLLVQTFIFLLPLGIHPQNPDLSQKEFLIELLEHNKIDAIGECGFDLFTSDFKANVENQEKAWALQLECAVKYEKPLVVHGRKCTHLFFRDIKMLKKVPAVIFHSWAGTFLEATSMLQKGVNAYFSFGKPIINGKKICDRMCKTSWKGKNSFWNRFSVSDLKRWKWNSAGRYFKSLWES